MKVGHGFASLAVENGTPMGGYAAREGRSSGALDELEVHAVSFATPAHRLVLVVADVLAINEDLADRVRRSVSDVLPDVADVWLAATHTHSGPEVGGRPGGGSTPVAWLERIDQAAVAAARAAVDNEEALRGEFHAGVLEDVGSPRGRDGAPATVSTDVLACRDEDGALRGVLAVVPVHPTVLPASSTVVSGDLISAVRRSLTRRLDAPWVVVATGAAGDISTRRTRHSQTPGECERLGEVAAVQIEAMLQRPAEPVWPRSGGSIMAARRTLVLPAGATDPGELRRLRVELEDTLAHERATGVASAVRTLETALQGVDVAERRRQSSSTALALAAARVGGLSLAGFGAEPFHWFHDAFCARTHSPALVLGYAGGYAGYLPDATAFDAVSYEALCSPFDATAAETAIAALIDLLPKPPEDQ
jgi:neutral ceramidase